ncbi:long-chain fatty acid transport protein [Limibacillus sp. MBR-115]|jgi:long-chain fatty acid transport protein
MEWDIDTDGQISLRGRFIIKTGDFGEMRSWIKYGASLCVLAGLPFVATGADAAGFALKEQSASGLGNAFAGATAGAEDLSYMFFNPAALAEVEGVQALTVASYIRPVSELKSSSGFNAFAGGALTGPSTQNDIGSGAALPAFYGAIPLTEDINFGLAINTPFGLETEYSPDWVGRFHGVRSELLTINVNPAIGWQITDKVSIGAGAQIQYIEADLTNATLTQVGEGHASLEGDDWGYGFNLGILVKPFDQLQLGAAYRSQVKSTLEGDVNIFVPGIGNLPTLGAQADVTLPDSFSLGFVYDINSNWSVMGEAQLTMWHKFNEIRIQFDNGMPDNVTTENWDDSVFVAAGATYKMDEDWTFRFGVAFDESPVPDNFRTPRIPDANRYWVTVGASYQVSDWFTVDAGYAHIFVEDSDVNLSGAGENLLRGSLTAEYESHVDILSVQGKISF